MFDNLTDRLQGTFRQLTGRGTLSEKNIEDAMRDVRVALLEADVNYDIVREFIKDVTAECLGEKVLKSVTPGQQTIKVVNDRLAELMGEANVPLELGAPPSAVMIVGLHGGGKTTSTAKLAAHLKKDGRRVLMVGLDVHRPAAIDQLEFLGRELDVPVYAERESKDCVAIAEHAMKYAKDNNLNTVLLDTAGRLQIDDELVQELVNIRKRVKPDEILLVADSALGQEAVSVATHFNDALDVSGIVLTKLDGDARGGAALSMRKVTGKPIKFIGVGEKTADFEAFHPDRMASRILGMGDVVSLVEKAAETISEEEAKKLEQKMLKNKFDLNDFLNQLAQMRKLGGMSAILDLMPGGRKLTEGIDVDENMLRHVEAIVFSMTPYEREHPEILSAISRRQRIANGSGRSLVEVQQLLKRFDMMREMMSKMGKMSKMMGGLGNLNLEDLGMGGLGGMGGMGPDMGGMPGAGVPPFGGGGGGTRHRRALSQKDKKAKRKKHKRKRR